VPGLRRFEVSSTVQLDGEPGAIRMYVFFGGRRSLTRDAVLAHWRDVHAPLALRHHPGMWHYHQISIAGVLAGPAYDGIALCAFPSEQDMAERFFGGFEDQAIIAADVARFADVERSPRRVRMIEWRGNEDDG
jgi:hypothetical protein